MTKTVCRLCHKGIFEIGGYLERVNPKGVDGIFECRPSCDAVQSQEKNLLDAIEPPVPEPEDCPHDPEQWVPGYGLAGGGMGMYMYCPLCERVVDKVQDISE